MSGKMKNTVALLLALLLCLVSASYAWLSDLWNSGKGLFDFGAAELEAPSGVMWLYDSAFDLGSSEPGGWQEHALTPDADDSFLNKAPGVEQTVSDEVYTFSLRSLHLGTVDNLVTLSKDNTVALRFAFDSTRHGNSVATVSFALAGELAQSIYVYDKDGVPQHTEEATIRALEDAAASGPFLKYRACIDTRALTPADAAYASLAFSATSGVGGQLSLIADGGSAPEGTFYIYVEITPGLAAFTTASEALNRYMPCTLLFDTLLSLEVY